MPLDVAGPASAQYRQSIRANSLNSHSTPRLHRKWYTVVFGGRKHSSFFFTFNHSVCIHHTLIHKEHLNENPTCVLYMPVCASDGQLVSLSKSGEWHIGLSGLHLWREWRPSEWHLHWHSLLISNKPWPVLNTHTTQHSGPPAVVHNYIHWPWVCTWGLVSPNFCHSGFIYQTCVHQMKWVTPNLTQASAFISRCQRERCVGKNLTAGLTRCTHSWSSVIHAGQSINVLDDKLIDHPDVGFILLVEKNEYTATCSSFKNRKPV